MNGVAATVTVLFLAAFVLFELPQINELILSQLRPSGADRAREIGGHINRTVGGYVAGNLLISVIAGVVAALTLWILHVPYALTLGVVVAIGDLVPLVGATIASILVIAVAYFAGGTTDGIIVFVVIMVYQQIENHLIQPAVYRRTVQMPALVVLIARAHRRRAAGHPRRADRDPDRGHHPGGRERPAARAGRAHQRSGAGRDVGLTAPFGAATCSAGSGAGALNPDAMAPMACVSSLGIIHIVLPSPAAICGSIWRYW